MPGLVACSFYIEVVLYPGYTDNHAGGQHLGPQVSTPGTSVLIVAFFIIPEKLKQGLRRVLIPVILSVVTTTITLIFQKRNLRYEESSQLAGANTLSNQDAVVTQRG